MDFITTPRAIQRPSLRKAGVKHGNGLQGLEDISLLQVKQKKFLDLLTEQRKKNLPVQLAGADLSHADLRYVDLTDVDLTGANLTNTNLTGAKLVRTNLSSATLVRTILINAHISDVMLTNAVVDRLTQSVLQQVSNQHWYEAAEQSIVDFSQKWENLRSVDGFNAFEAILKRINTRDFKSSVTNSEILEIIEAVIKYPDICRLIFQAALDVDVNCPFHLLAMMNTAQGLTKFVTLFNDNANQQEMLMLAKGMVKQNLLDQVTLPVMRNQWSEGRRNCNQDGTGPNVSEALKVQLALHHQLAKALKLPFPIKSLAHTPDAELDHSDKKFVIDFVNSYISDKEQLVDALIALPVWKIYLNHALNDKIVGKVPPNTVDLLLRQETEKMLCEFQMMELGQEETEQSLA